MDRSLHQLCGRPARCRPVQCSGTSSYHSCHWRLLTWRLLCVALVGWQVIAFSVLITQLDSNITTILWVLLSYFLVVAAVVPITGKLVCFIRCFGWW